MRPERFTPGAEDELAARIREARGSLSVTGGGTRLLPGEAQGERLSTAGLTGITLYEPAALTLVARAGTPLGEIEALLASEGQRLAFEPPPRPGSTIGGVVAANASGPRRVRDGAARDSLLGVRFVDGSGQVVRNGGRVMKNVTGYDLVKLMAGSRGRLGVLTEVSLRTQPVPPARLTLALPALTVTEAIPPLTAALTGPWDVTAAAWLPGHGALIRIEGLDRSVALRAESLAARLAVFGPVERHDEGPWDLLSGASTPGSGAEPRSGPDLWRIVCRPSQAAAIIGSNPGASPLALDWGGALILLGMPLGQPPALPPGARATCLRGAHRGPLPARDPVTERLEAGLRAQFDPRGVFAAPLGGGA